MKKINYLALTAILAFSACKNGETSQKVKDVVDTVTTKVENAVDTARAKYDEDKQRMFVKEVIKANAQELHLLALARQKGINKELKANAKMMEADHKRLGEKMKAYASAKGISVDVDSADLHTNFDNDQPGSDWDKNWADRMVDDHKKTIKDFEKAKDYVKDEELKSLVTVTLPVLHHHLDMSAELQANMSNELQAKLKK